MRQLIMMITAIGLAACSVEPSKSGTAQQKQEDATKKKVCVRDVSETVIDVEGCDVVRFEDLSAIEDTKENKGTSDGTSQDGSDDPDYNDPFADGGGSSDGSSDGTDDSGSDGGQDDGQVDDGETDGTEDDAGGDDGMEVQRITYTADVRAFLTAKCVSCHNGTGNISDLSNYTIAADRAEASYRRMANGTMPPQGNVAQAELDVFDTWIMDGVLE